MNGQMYQNLAAERQEEWADRQRAAADAVKVRERTLLDEPDVQQRPPDGSTWNGRGLRCLCGTSRFTVHRFVLVNGKNHRVEATCQHCGRRGVYDYETQHWWRS